MNKIYRPDTGPAHPRPKAVIIQTRVSDVQIDPTAAVAAGPQAETDRLAG